MTRRDHLLAAALSGLCANPSVVMEHVDSKVIAQFATDLVNDLIGGQGQDRAGDDDMCSISTFEMPPETLPGIRGRILSRVGAARERREEWSDDRLADSARLILDGNSWENEDWRNDIMAAIIAVGTGKEKGKGYDEARKLLSELIPEDELCI